MIKLEHSMKRLLGDKVGIQGGETSNIFCCSGWFITLCICKWHIERRFIKIQHLTELNSHNANICQRAPRSKLSH